MRWLGKAANFGSRVLPNVNPHRIAVEYRLNSVTGGSAKLQASSGLNKGNNFKLFKCLLLISYESTVSQLQGTCIVVFHFHISQYKYQIRLAFAVRYINDVIFTESIHTLRHEYITV